jgi:hypothetical protein
MTKTAQQTFFRSLSKKRQQIATLREELEGLNDYLDLTEARVRDEGKPRLTHAQVKKHYDSFKAICLAVLACAAPRMMSQPNALPAADQVVTNKFYSESGKWMRASNTNCLIWDSFPRDGESVTWSGNIVDGKADGIGVVQWFTNGTPTTSYEGEMKNGLSNGHGMAKSAGGTFEGDFKNGSLVSKTMTIHYPTGGWYKGEQQGGFKDGQGEEMMHGGKYIGRFKHDFFDGLGELLLPNGDKITGDWQNSKLVGAGTCINNKGESFKVKMTEKGIERF